MITAMQVREMAGYKDVGFITRMKRDDPTFPKPVKKGGPGKGRSLWSEEAIIEWLSNRLNAKPLGLDNAMAQLIITRGWQRGGKTIGQRYKRAS